MLTSNDRIIDDLMAMRRADSVVLIVNASRAGRRPAPSRPASRLASDRPHPEQALIALQGPRAADVLGVAPAAARLAFMHGQDATIDGVTRRATPARRFDAARRRRRTDRRDAVGPAESSPPPARATRWTRGRAALRPGHRRDDGMIEAGLAWTISSAAARRNFPGAAVILAQLKDGRADASASAPGKAPPRRRGWRWPTARRSA